MTSGQLTDRLAIRCLLPPARPLNFGPGGVLRPVVIVIVVERTTKKWGTGRNKVKWAKSGANILRHKEN